MITLQEWKALRKCKYLGDVARDDNGNPWPMLILSEFRHDDQFSRSLEELSEELGFSSPGGNKGKTFIGWQRNSTINAWRKRCDRKIKKLEKN